MYRSDYNGPRASARLEQAIRRAGGINIFGEPLYRLVHSSHRRTPSGGMWVDWSDDLSIADRKDGVNTPLRRVVETRHILLYPNIQDKWVLEKWCGPEAYGSPEDWYKPTTLGGTMLYIPSERASVASLGEYPSRGDYEAAGYAFPAEALCEATVLTAIGRLEHQLDKMPSTPEGRVLRRCFEAQEREELKQRQFKAYAKEVFDEADFAFNNNAFSSGAGIKRAHSSAKLLKKLGITQHYLD